MARKHSKNGRYSELHQDEEAPETAVHCWLCSRPTGKTVVWHHPVPKSRGGREVVPMHPICQQTLMANFTTSELQRLGWTSRACWPTPQSASLSIGLQTRTPILRQR